MAGLKTCGICKFNNNKVKTVLYEGSFFECSKKEYRYLCKTIDMTHLDNVLDDQGLPFISYKSIKGYLDLTYKNKKHVDDKISSGDFSLPITYNQFDKLIQKIHKQLFRETGVTNYGRYRRSGEDVFIDTGQHQFQGATKEKIIPGLKEIWTYILDPAFRKFSQKRPTIEKVNILCSDFIVAFFRVHPFRDGNGRTGRLFVKIILQTYSFDLKIQSSNKTARNYVTALRFAHKKYRNSNMTIKSQQHREVMNRYMYKYFQKFIFDSSYVPLEEEDPRK